MKSKNFGSQTSSLKTAQRQRRHSEESLNYQQNLKQKLEQAISTVPFEKQRRKLDLTYFLDIDNESFVEGVIWENPQQANSYQ